MNGRLSTRRTTRHWLGLTGALLVAALGLSACVDTIGGDAGTITAVPSADTSQQIDPKEVAIAEREHPKIVAAFGGTYEDHQVEIAVARVVGRLVAASPEPWRGYRVTILNSPAVNAFALPGGYVYVTRGLLALANDTSEVAAVIAHEMAHVTARHAFLRAQRAEAAEVATQAVQGVVQDPAVQRVALASTQVSLARFSQIQELEADRVGITTLSKAGYDPFAAVRFLTSMARLAAWKNGLPEDDTGQTDFLSSHPSTPERLTQAEAVAEATGITDGERDRDGYLSRIDGVMFGDDPVEGYVRGREFLHAKLGFGFTVPDGFMIDNTSKAVLATNAEGVALRFDGADVAAGGDLVSYLQSGWVNGLDSASVRTVSINGLPAAVASANARGFAYRIAVIRFGDKTFRFLFAIRGDAGKLDEIFTSTISTFRALSDQEKSELAPLKVRVVTVAPGDTAEGLARRMVAMDRALVLFRALNGLAANQQPQVGTKVKLVVDR
ncbi:M48 family metalloprotease [Oryzibacter oryziterrae]|uniref:M48 family metalloprotease n=1 Tax=Oryzibacter oryziterrae TaxID=2766474 RepID=UPI001F0041AB|nr:M48 family metalloprotease [Oryzibacter oryziterrae]